MQRFKLTIEYDGRPFVGWQRQACEKPSVQGVIEQAVAKFDPRQPDDRDILAYCAGRTDAGVHGLAMVAHLDVKRDYTAKKIKGALNALMRPHPVSILSVDQVDNEFHARFTSK